MGAQGSNFHSLPGHQKILGMVNREEPLLVDHKDPELRHRIPDKIESEEYGLYTYLPARKSPSEDDKIIKYDEKGTVTIRALWNLHGSVFLNSSLALHTVFYVIIAVLVGFISYACGNVDKKSGEHMANIVNYLTTIQGIMLGLYLSMSLSRWWSMRIDGIGAVWAAIDDICLILASHIRDPADRIYKRRVLRLGLLSYNLIFKQGRGKEDLKNLTKLVKRGLITEGELELIKDLPSKPQVVWVWISQVIHGIAVQGKIRYPAVMVPILDELCAKGRGGIGTLFTYTDTQLPYVWVHMLSVIVTLVNLVIALKCGLNMGYLLEMSALPGQAMECSKLFAELCTVVILPFAFTAFMMLGAKLSDPLGQDLCDFPAFVYHIGIRDENRAFFDVGEETPSTVFVDYL